MRVVPFEHALAGMDQNSQEALGTKDLVPVHYRCAVVTACGIVACFRHERDAYDYVALMQGEDSDVASAYCNSNFDVV